MYGRHMLFASDAKSNMIGTSLSWLVAMKLTDYTDYTLRVLIYLGLHQGELATIQQIAESYDISRNHLMKIVHRHSRDGLVATVRGRRGGLRLALHPEQKNGK